MPSSATGAPDSASACVNGVAGTSGRLKRHRVRRRLHIGRGDLLHGIDGVCNDIELTLHTSDFLVGERDSGQIAQMYYFFACECRHSPNYTNQM